MTTYFLLGLACGLAVSLALIAALVAVDRRRFPECARCCVALPLGGASDLCPRCAALAETEGRE